MFSDYASWAIDCYLYLLESALPVALIFGLSNLIVDVILRAAFSGKLKF